MYLQKLVTVMTALNKSSLQKLEEYIHSPYFRVQPTVVSMFDYFMEHSPYFSDENINPKTIAKHTKSKTKHRQELAATRLVNTIYDFIALSQWQKDEYNSFLPLIRGLKELELYELANTEYKRAMKSINEDCDQDVDVFYLRHTLTTDATSSFDTLLQRNVRNDISEATETLEQFYALKFLRLACESLNRRKLVGTLHNATSIAKALEILTPLSTPQYPYVWIYMNVYKLLTAETFEEGRKAYFRIEWMIKRNGQEPLQQYLLDGMQYSINWSLQWYSKGYTEAAQYYLWWIDFKIKHDLMLIKNQIQPIAFRNPIALAVEGFRSPEWIQQFIETFAPKLPLGNRSINTVFAKALLHYYKKEHETAARLFQQIYAKGEPIFNVIIRKWQFMNLYESHDSKVSVLQKTLESFEKYLQRNENQLPMKPIFAKFIRYAGQIVSPEETINTENTQNKLMKEHFFPGKNWLDSQLHRKLYASPKCA